MKAMHILLKQWFSATYHSSSIKNATSSTLIDKIFTNNIGDMHQSVHGLFIVDASDHFPVSPIAKQIVIKRMTHTNTYL